MARSRPSRQVNVYLKAPIYETYRDVRGAYLATPVVIAGLIAYLTCDRDEQDAIMDQVAKVSKPRCTLDEIEAEWDEILKWIEERRADRMLAEASAAAPSPAPAKKPHRSGWPLL